MAYIPCPYCDLAPRQRDYAAHLEKHAKAGDRKQPTNDLERMDAMFQKWHDRFALLLEQAKGDPPNHGM